MPSSVISCETSGIVSFPSGGQIRGYGGEGWGRGAEETAGPVWACLLLVELEAVPLRGVVAFSNLVESPTVENEEGSCEG